MTKENHELTAEALEQASGGWKLHPAQAAAIIAHMKNVPVVPQYLSLAVMRPWFK